MSSKRHAQAPDVGLFGKKSRPCGCEAENESETPSPARASRCSGDGDDVHLVDTDGLGSFNPRYREENVLSGLKEKYSQQKNFDNGTGILLNASPFMCCEIPNFIVGSKYLQVLKADLENLEFFPKNNDLYKFHQSDDLKAVPKKSVIQLREILYGEFRRWLECVSGILLSDNIDMSCSRYTYTDTLLCHDDELEGRRIAFIYYLVPDNWSDDDGGSLDLFSVNEVGEPKDVVKSICPQKNKLVFFEVTPVSFHQVREVMSEDKCRLSVSGWFHGPPIDRPQPFVAMPSPLEPCLTVDEQLFYQWINPMYLDIEVQSQIQTTFESESEIQLPDFIKPEMYESLLGTLQGDETPWQQRGPANKRFYYSLEEEKYPSVLVNCVQFFRSDAMFVVLSNLTGLSFHELAMSEEDSEISSKEQLATSDNNAGGEESKTQQPTSSGQEGNNVGSEMERPDNVTSVSSKSTARCRGEVRCWRPGCYTLMADTDIDQTTEFALDARYSIGCPGWQTEFGGYTSYIVKDEDEELLTVIPAPNSLALVYRDSETLQFVKYINTKAQQLDYKQFYDVTMVYYE